MVSFLRHALVLTRQFLGGLTNGLVLVAESEQFDGRSHDSTDRRPLVTGAGDW